MCLTLRAWCFARWSRHWSSCRSGLTRMRVIDQRDRPLLRRDALRRRPAATGAAVRSATTCDARTCSKAKPARHSYNGVTLRLGKAAFSLVMKAADNFRSRHQLSSLIARGAFSSPPKLSFAADRLCDVAILKPRSTSKFALGGIEGWPKSISSAGAITGFWAYINFDETDAASAIDGTRGWVRGL